MSMVMPIGEGIVTARRKVTVMQGEALASGAQEVEYNTILGSCVATCLFDPVARIGGMNHFLLAEPSNQQSDVEADEHYGVFLMELLINEMMALGASKTRMKARLYGGANMQLRLKQIGSVNAAFAREFLKREGIELGHHDLGGDSARRVHFKPASGQVRCTTTQAVNAERITPARKPAPRKDRGEVELF